MAENPFKSPEQAGYQLRTLLIVLALAAPGAIIMAIVVAKVFWAFLTWPEPN